MREVRTRNSLYGFDFIVPDERRKGREERKSVEIKQLWQRSHEIVTLAVRGFKNTEIAEILNINPVTVSNTLNSELGELKLADLRLERDIETKKVTEKVRVLTNKALNVYHEIFDDESGEIGLKGKGNFATEFLKEMSGLRAPTKIQAQNVTVSLSREELEEFKKQGIKAAREAGMLVNVEELESGTSEVKSKDPQLIFKPDYNDTVKSKDPRLIGNDEVSFDAIEAEEILDRLNYEQS